MIAAIRTVTGDIPASELGYCHAHEHIMVRDGGPYMLFDPNLAIDNFEKSLAEVGDYKLAGGNSFVDAQPVGAGRKCRDLLTISEKSGVNIIASTGFHLRKFYPEESRIYSLSADEAQELFERELTEGMYDGMDPQFDAVKTDIRAGVIKCALDVPERWDEYKNLFEAAAKTAIRFHAPMLVHTEKKADTIGLLDYLEKSGVDLTRVSICHLDRTCPDLTIHKEVAHRGAYLEYDTVGRYKYHDDERECAIIREIIEAGFENKILLSLDTTKARLAAYGGTPGLAFIRKTFETTARGYGIPQAAFEKFMCKNPAEAFLLG